MPTDPHQSHPELDAEENALAQLGYETEDVAYKSLARSIGWFFVFVIFCGVAGAVIFFLFIGGSIGGAVKEFTRPNESTAPFVKRLPAEPNPLLQTNVTARTDIRDLRRGEEELLHGAPTFIDRSKGTVRIPIDRAMEIYLHHVGASTTAPTTIESGAPPQTGEAPLSNPEIVEGAPHS